EDHGDRVAPNIPHLFFASGRQVPTLEQDAASDDVTGPRQQPQDRQGRHSLPATGLAHQAQDAAGPKRQIDAVDRLDHPLAGFEIGLEPLQAKHIARDGGASGGQRSKDRGSNASRSPSPTKFTQSTASRIIRPGNSAAYGA